MFKLPILSAVMLTVFALHEAPANPPKLVTTVPALSSLVRELAGEQFTVTNIRTTHGYGLRPAEALAIDQADRVFAIARQFETYLAASKKTVFLAESPTITVLPSIGSNHGHRQHENDHDDHGHDDEEQHHDDHADNRYDSNLDPHIWLSPANGLAMAKVIASELTQLRPEASEAIADRLRQTEAAIQRTNQQLKIILKPIAGQTYVVYHNAYRYFERSFDLPPPLVVQNRQGIKGRYQLNQDKAQVGATCLFLEPDVPSRQARALTEQLAPITPAALDPLGSVGLSYPQQLIALAETMVACLQSASSLP